MAVLSQLFATPTPTPAAVPISDGSASLNAWMTDGSSGIVAAQDVTYSNGSSGLGADNVQDAIDELALSSGSGAVDIQTALDALSTTHGAIIFRGASAWESLEPGPLGYFLMTNGSGANPSWQPMDAPNLIYGQWVAAVDAAGGTYEADSKDIALALSDALVAFSGYAKIKWLLPLLGSNLAAARVPLIDVLTVGIAGNTNFVDGDFTQATGLKGNGSNKFLDLLIKPSQLGTTNNGGMGYIENDIDFTGSGTEPIGSTGASGAQRFSLDLRSGRRFASWGAPANVFDENVAAPNGHYYFQRLSSTSRELFLDATLLGSNSSSDTASGAADNNVHLMQVDYAGTPFYWKGRCAAAYMTDGTLTPTEVTDLNTLLQTYLIIPTGR